MIKICKIKKVKTPIRSGRNAGYDFFIPNDKKEPYYIEPYGQIKIGLGVKIRIPKNNVFIAFNKSGICTKLGLIVGACVVDENYTGEIHCHMINTTERGVFVKPNQKIIQFVLIKQEYHNIELYKNEDKMYENFNKKERGDNGFGSTG